ncbi:hypothetical protein XINFAN_00032 [Pseudogemmobacter humi]|uniref:Uncharacterized protein n=1 Tax=Pseudogemmobacter humi TaxID=2483812 RepID=A0A3P5W6H7_9RHOB|nr:hypothetical protein XINFAN_00032 [Pseudogemmobacter humi]
MIAKLSFEPIPRPPETTIFALVSSGRSEAATRSSTKAERSPPASPVTASTGAEPPAPAAAKLAVLTENTFVESPDFTV